MYVEIDGIRRASITNEDCIGNYDTVNGGTSNGGSYCDSTFNMYDPSIVPNYSTSCSSATDPTCYGRIHTEIDHDWKAAGYCGPSTTCDDGALGSQTTTSSLIDIQGFISWDPGHLTEQWHSFNGWEIHPLTGWRLHQTSSNPDFSISASPTGVSALAGATGTSTVSVTPVNGFTGTVSLAASVSPSGLTCTLNPTSVVLGSSQTSTLSCNGPAGTYTVTATGTSGLLSHSTTVTFTVTNFAMNASPTSLTLSVGNSGSSTITVSSVNGFSGAVVLSSSVSPSTGLTCNLSPTSISGSGTSNLSCSASSTGSFSVTVTGTSGSLTHSTTVAYTVSSTDFSVTANPTSVSVNSGSTGVSTITVSPINGFTGTVTLASLVSPAGLACGLSPAGLVLGGSQTSTLSCNGPAGTYTVTVTGTSGSLSHATTVAYNVTATSIPDFSVVANPSAVTVNPGVSGNSTITIAPLNGFTGTVTLTSTVSPGGLTCSLSPNSVVLGPSQTSTLSCSGPGGTYNVTVTANSGGLSHSVTVNFSVRDFTITANPATVNVTPAASGTSTITVTSLGGFSGTITLASSPSNGLTASVSPVNVTLTPNGAVTSTLTVTSGTIGNYVVNVTGTSGSRSRSISVKVIISDFSITASPNSLSLPPSSTVSSLVTLTSLNGFNGAVTLSATITPTGPKTSLSTTLITLSPGGSGTATLTIRALKKTPVGSYTVTITATSGSLSHTITLQVTVT